MDTNIKESIKKYILIYTLGYLNAIKTNSIIINYHYFDRNINRDVWTNPPYYRIAIIWWLKEKRFNQNFIDIVKSVIELEDIHSVIPDNFNQELNKCIDETIVELKKIPQNINICDKNACSVVIDFLSAGKE